MDLTVGQFASRPVHTIETGAPFLDALKMMSERRISCVVVLEEGEAVGILTERDIVFASNWVLGQPKLLVREVMNKPVLTVTEEMSIGKAREVFREHGIRHLVVLDKMLNLGGVFTQTDLVRAMRDRVFADIKEISGLMSAQVLQVRSDVAARYALSQMARHAVSCVVVTKDDSPVGIFTERDVVRLVADGVDLDTVTVDTVMSVSLVTASASMAPTSAIALMHKHAVRRLLVVDGQSSVVGILTQTDLGRALDANSCTAELQDDYRFSLDMGMQSSQML